MLVDNGQQQAPFPIIASSFDPLSDFLNMDLLNGSSSSPSSRDSASPNLSFTGLLTPPQSQPFPAFNAADYPTNDSFFNFTLDDDFSKPVDSLIPITSSTPYGFFGDFSPRGNEGLVQESSSSQGSSSPHSPLSLSAPSPQSNAPMMAIDPQLVDTPATSRALSDFGGEEEEEEEEVPPAPEPVPVIPTIKVGGHGKLRKGTVQGGGITKKAMSSVVRDKENTQTISSVVKKPKDPRDADAEDDDPDDWRPTPEEYKKMSSKEKRQLRNKISARNFRVRRKEYITKLEGDISERDRLLDAIRSELGSSKSENVALRQEISALKKALLNGRGTVDAPVLPPPAPLPAVSAAATVSSSSSSPAPEKSSLLTPNIQKDLPNSPRIGARPFWGGANVGIGGGFTPVHTAFLPDFSMAALAKPTMNSSVLGALQENLNPAMNNAPGGTPAKDVQNNVGVNLPGFESFADANAFTLKNFDTFRMQLWSKIGDQGIWSQQQQQQQQYQQQLRQLQSQQIQKDMQPSPFVSGHLGVGALGGLAQGLRPAFFSSALSPKGVARKSLGVSALPTPPASPRLAPTQPVASTSSAGQQQQQAAVIAALASQTLLQKLGGAFWDAFAGSSDGVGSSSGSSITAPGAGVAKAFDADKVRRVLEGKAVVRVVDVEPTGTGVATVAGIVPKVKVEPPRSGGSSSPSVGANSEMGERKCLCAVTDLLEESMRSLSIAKKA